MANTLCHTTWECKYHIVFILKMRKKVLYGKLKDDLGPIFHALANMIGCKIIEGHICVDHVHMCIEIPPKISVSKAIGYIKRKSAITIARDFLAKERNFSGENFWARGYYVSTVGRDEQTIREYIRNQEREDARHDQH